MTRSMCCYKAKKWMKQVQLYLSFPQIWVFAITFILAILTFIASFSVKNKYWSTLSGNIFAGLVTGMVISLISGTKEIYLAKQEMLHDWLAKLHKQIMEFFEMRDKFMKQDYGEVPREDFIYYMGAHANWVNEFILQSTFDRKLAFDAKKYCKDNYGYDAMAYCDSHNELKEKISFQPERLSQREVLDLFNPIYDGIRKLNIDVCRDMELIETKIETAKRSLI